MCQLKFRCSWHQYEGKIDHQGGRFAPQKNVARESKNVAPTLKISTRLQFPTLDSSPTKTKSSGTSSILEETKAKAKKHTTRIQR